MRDAALDFRANPELVNNCPKTLQHCKTVTKFDPNNGDDGGQVEGKIDLQYKYPMQYYY
jgi:hypothetical protein